MSFPRRLLPLFCIATLLVAVYIITGLNDHQTSSSSLWRVYGHVGEGEVVGSESLQLATTASLSSIILATEPSSIPDVQIEQHAAAAPAPAHAPSPPRTYTQVMVVPCTKNENTSWIERELPGLETVIYVANDPDATLHPPRNKGHEAMIYLTYIIEHYDALPDIVLFMHAHRWTYHNNDLQGSDAVQLIKTLSHARVVRQGYMNLRCHWEPGCPGHLHPLANEPDFYRLQGIVADQWPKLFPTDPIPETLAQPCCAQFAVTRERIRSNPLRKYVFFRDWLLRTPLTDYYSGRIWEYLWHFIFTGKTVLCPEEHVCYCDGFGICFGGREEYNEYFSLRKQRDGFERELREWYERAKAVAERQNDKNDGEGEGEGEENDTGKESKNSGLGMDADADMPEMGRDVFLRDQIDALNRELDDRREQAMEQGRDPKNRAIEAGREWNDGDGF